MFQEVVVGEQGTGPEVCEGEEVGRGICVELKAEGGGWGRREVALEVESGGAVGTPTSPELEGRHGDAEGDEGGCAGTAEGVKRKGGAGIAKGAAGGLQVGGLEQGRGGSECSAAEVGNEEAEGGGNGAPDGRVGGLCGPDLEVSGGEGLGTEENDF